MICDFAKIKHISLYIFDYIMVMCGLVLPIFNKFNITVPSYDIVQFCIQAFIIFLLMIRTTMHYFLNKKHVLLKNETQKMLLDKQYTEFENKEFVNFMLGKNISCQEIDALTTRTKQTYSNKGNTEPTMLFDEEDNPTPKSDVTMYIKPFSMNGLFSILRNSEMKKAEQQIENVVDTAIVTINSNTGLNIHNPLNNSQLTLPV